MSFGRERRSLFILLVVLGLLAASAPVLGQVTDNKTYTVHVDGVKGPKDIQNAEPEVFSGDADALIRLIISNTSTSQSIGSANVTVPDPFVLDAGKVVKDERRPEDDSSADAVPGGPVIELRSLGIAPGDSAAFLMTVDVQTCAPTEEPPTFTVAVKQSNEFSGAGNDFFLDTNPQKPSDLQVNATGTCDLTFAHQPGDAERGATITRIDYTPDADPISVEVRDAGDTGRATHATPTILLTASGVAGAVLGGTTCADAGNGVAEFPPGPTLDPSAFGYTLVASTIEPDTCDNPAPTGSFRPGVSEPFNIVDAQVDCPQGQPCRGTATATRNGQSVSASFGAGQRDANLLLSLGAADVPPFECAGYAPRTVHAAQFLILGASGDEAGEDAGGDRDGAVTLTIPGASQPVNAHEVCWATPEKAFTTDGGTPATEQGVKPGTVDTPLYVGLLPDCPRRGEPARPCISVRDLDRRTSVLTIRIETTGADPWMRG